ncbi:hypothetical protein BP5796_09331 [Coleophoma crateriformis]|uniref:Transcription factor domain-containing protein n=1 Tax=Coleophoma crateriformis TaxID=565419 RepID=A0A3D8R4D0_9HELO|nr:hypothetical protein BP5796_09331 [Coleophoma crateriformis]
MRQTLSDGEEYLRKTLIGCLLVFCFEGFQGNQTVAISHAQSGYALLRNWIQKRINSHVQQRGLWPISSPAPDAVEDDLVHAFHRLDLQIMSVVDIQPVEVHQVGKLHGQHNIDSMPRKFASLTEAQKYWELILRRSAHFIYSAKTISKGLHGQPSSLDTDLAETFSINLGSVIHRSYPSDPVPQLLRTEHSKYLRELRCWRTAVAPLLLSPDEQTVVGAMGLQAFSSATQLVMHALLATEECSFDRYLPEYREIVSLARRLFKA